MRQINSVSRIGLAFDADLALGVNKWSTLHGSKNEHQALFSKENFFDITTILEQKMTYLKENYLKLIIALPLCILAVIAVALLSSNESVDKEGNICIGDCVNGQGTLTYKKTNTKYVGYFKNGKREGQGTVILVDGRKYVGEWRNDYLHGRGIYTWPDGSKQDGIFKEDKFFGNGIMIYGNGDKFDGEFKNNILDGRGTYVSVNGNTYVGEWKNGKMEGQGTYTGSGFKYVGEFSNGTYEGQGTFIFEDGKKYIGGWSNGKMSGNGTLFYADGKKYIGQWRSGKPVEGQGGLYLADGSKVDDSDSSETDWGEIIDWTLRGLAVISALKGH